MAEFQAKPCEQLAKRDILAFDQWIVNPPRTGLPEKVVETIMRQKPKRVVYISCNPSTLARDTKAFYENGYRITKGQVYDMFAETTHLESVLYFEAAKN